ncbi:hypothetical protein DFQ28_004191, partial [Apophysomyces sp. BC1034]
MENNQESSTVSLPRLFSLAPLPSFRWRFITINARTLSTLASLHLPNGSDYDNNMNLFNQCFDLERYDFMRVDNKQVFRNQLMTDGFSIHLQFSRAKRPKDITDEELRLEDLNIQEVEEYLRPAAVDPGVSHVFTASYGCGNYEHEIRRCSTAEYYALMGSKRRNKQLDKEKQDASIKEIESHFPTAKTADSNEYAKYL